MDLESLESSEDPVLRKRLHRLQSRANRLAKHFGHKDLDTLEKAVGIKVEPNTHVDQTPDATVDGQTCDLREELNSKTREISSLRAQVLHLSQKYDELLAAKDRAAEKYKADYQKWKAFKAWLYKSSVEKAQALEEPSEQRDNVLEGSAKELQLGGHGVPGHTPTPDRIISGFPVPSSMSKRQTLRDEDENPFLSDPMELARPFLISPSSLKAESSPHHTVSITRDEDSVGGPFKKRKRTASECGQQSLVVKKEEVSPECALRLSPRRSSPKKLSPVKRALSAKKLSLTNGVRQYKGNGRYRTSLPNQSPSVRQTRLFQEGSSKDTTSASSPLAYVGVERSKESRKKLHAEDCFCCRDYYDMMNGALPEKLKAPLWCSPTRSRAENSSNRRPIGLYSNVPMTVPPSRRHQLHDIGRDHIATKSSSFRNEPLTPPRTGGSRLQTGTHTVQDHRQLISRHRHHFPTPATPPDYWEIGFPTTQDVLRINERAARERQANGDR